VHWAENAGNPALVVRQRLILRVEIRVTGNTEGKGVRFGIQPEPRSSRRHVEWRTGSTRQPRQSLAARRRHDSFNMLLGKSRTWPGTGLVSMILAAQLAVFIGALMIVDRLSISATRSALRDEAHRTLYAHRRHVILPLTRCLMTAAVARG